MKNPNKKILSRFVALSALLMAMMWVTPAEAFLPPNAFKLGGVMPGMTLAEAEAVLGTPVGVMGNERMYSNNLELKIKFDRVKKVEAKYGSAATTADGVKLGQAGEVLSKVYGQADKVSYDDGGYEVEYTYYSQDGQYKMEFEVAGGYITKLKCELRNY